MGGMMLGVCLLSVIILVLVFFTFSVVCCLTVFCVPGLVWCVWCCDCILLPVPLSFYLLRCWLPMYVELCIGLESKGNWMFEVIWYCHFFSSLRSFCQSFVSLECPFISFPRPCSPFIMFLFFRHIICVGSISLIPDVYFQYLMFSLIMLLSPSLSSMHSTCFHECDSWG